MKLIILFKRKVAKMTKRGIVLVTLIVAILVSVGILLTIKHLKHQHQSPFGPGWKSVTEVDGVVYYVHTKQIAYLPNRIVTGWVLWVPSGEERERNIKFLKGELSFKGEDPQEAEKLWYVETLVKINCETHQIAELEAFFYSSEGKLLSKSLFYQSQPEKWEYIPPNTPMEGVENYMCKKYRR